MLAGVTSYSGSSHAITGFLDPSARPPMTRVMTDILGAPVFPAGICDGRSFRNMAESVRAFLSRLRRFRSPRAVAEEGILVGALPGRWAWHDQLQLPVMGPGFGRRHRAESPLPPDVRTLRVKEFLVDFRFAGGETEKFELTFDGVKAAILRRWQVADDYLRTGEGQRGTFSRLDRMRENLGWLQQHFDLATRQFVPKSVHILESLGGS